MGDTPSKENSQQVYTEDLPTQLVSDSGCRLWYRHSGEDEIDKMPYIPESQLTTVEDYNTIIRSVHPYQITHLYAQIDQHMLPLDFLCPNAIRIKLVGNRQTSYPLDCLGSLRKLKKIGIRGFNMSKGLPDAICSLSSLTKLLLASCQLRDLPERFKALSNLQILQIFEANFANGLPEAISELSMLKQLVLVQCNLRDIPMSLSKLQHLEKLEISFNKFTHLPKVIYKLNNLNELDFSSNKELRQMEPELLALNNLKKLICVGCELLELPPYSVCQQGLPAIRKYFSDSLAGQETENKIVPVVVVGNFMAGKTSLIRSLVSGKRKLTFRNEISPLDETTRVFKMETCQLKDTTLKFIDFGGHEVYHLAYQLALKQHCIPIIVVNMEEFAELARSKGYREATRRRCVDWLSHLYLASPNLGPPILVFTHLDKLTSEVFSKAKQGFLFAVEAIRNEMIDDQMEFSKDDLGFCEISHVSNTAKQLFNPEETFEIGVEQVQDQLLGLMHCIEQRSSSFKVIIPKIWKELENFVEMHKDKACIDLSFIKNSFTQDKAIEVVLRYFHDSGKIFWFENIRILKQYVFHQIPIITDMISILFHHSSKSKWEQRLQTFRTFRFENQIIEKQTYEQFIKSFTESGLLNEVLLIHLLKTETNFPHEAAIEVLKSFCIIHGPVTQEYGKGYFVPYFTQEFTNENLLPPNDVQLKMEILFNGLHLPKYVHQLITVEVLNFISDETCSIKVYGNGTFVGKGEQSLHLVHDYNNRKFMILVSSPIELIGSSWSLLTSLIAHILNKLANVWRAIRPVITFYCSHCLLIRSPTPDTKVNPSWLFAAPKESHLNNRFFVSVKSFRGVEPVYCNNGMQPGTSKQTVPKPFKFPCFEFSECEMSKLKDYTEKLQRNDFFKPSGLQAINYPVENEDSEVSDVEQQGYFGTQSNACIKMELKPCTKDSVTRLFSNTTKVYPMNTEVKGRVLILDNRLFKNKPGYARKGGEIDYVNIRRLFEKMSFEIATDEEDTTDLTSEEMFQAIKDETVLEVHKHLSMFVLIIMSHGQTGDQILSHDNKWVKLGDIKQLLSASQFQSMKGKPKLIIIQACSGNRIDYGDTKNSSNDPINVQGAGSHTSLEENIASQDDQNSFLTSQLSQEQFDAESSYSENAEAAIPPRSLPNFEDIHLDSDDFFVMKASSDDYVSTRSLTHGSCFIRILVATFYKHACHRDLESLAKIIQNRVRESSIRRRKNGKKWLGGVVPVHQCTFTNDRKLYFFPEFPPVI